jgi:hypothetical protein
MKRTLFYDCEIINPIRDNGDWRRYTYLGISVIGCYASWLTKDQRLQAFVNNGHFDDLQGFQDLVNEAEQIVGFNSIGFDDPLCQAHGLHIETTYDLMVEVRRAAGEPLSGRCTPGYNLARLSEVNLGRKKTGHGADVPVLWQAGKKQEVIDYCLNDVMLLVGLYQRRTHIIDPVRYGDVILHCDPSLTDWREITATINQLFAERILAISTQKNVWHWSGANIWRVEIVVFQSLILKFPIWLQQCQPWRDYVGLPFQKPPIKLCSHPRKFELANKEDEEFDPIPF